MEKETYDIDDILAEVKKHNVKLQEENSKEENSNVENTAKEKSSDLKEESGTLSDADDKISNTETIPDENVEELTAQENEEFEIKEFSLNEGKTKDGFDDEFGNSDVTEKDEIPQEIHYEDISSKDESSFSEAEEKMSSTADIPNVQEKLSSDETKIFQNPQETKNANENILQPDENGMVDILQVLNNEEKQVMPNNKNNKSKSKFSKTKKGKALKKVLISVIAVLLVAIIVSGVVLNNLLGNIAENGDDGDIYDASTYYDGMDFLQEDFPVIEEGSASEMAGYRDYLKNWYKNGDPVRSSHVLNVMLIGEDTREEEISEASRADSAIIASINIDTGVIHMTSVLRDLFVYYEVDGEGHYGKINESASIGGINTYINTIERNYKIAIDGYAIVNFASFPKIIDSLGGVDIKITEAEINEINNHPGVYNDVGEVYIEKNFEGSEGVMTLDGIQALAYCRIRHIDSDDMRADRQKTVLNELLNKMKSSSALDAVKAVNQLSKYTKTSYSKKELISIGNLALRDNWLKYDIESTNVPAEENRKGGQNFSASKGSWIWLADIPKDAYELQTAIYGKSNIQLSENRADYIALGK